MLKVITSAHEKLTVAASSATLVNPVSSGSAGGATFALVQILDANIRYRRDSGAPTATLGTQGLQNSYILLTNIDMMRDFRAIREGATSAVLEVEYYSGVPEIWEGQFILPPPSTVTSLTVPTAIVPTGGIAAAGGFTVSGRVFHTGGAPPQVSTDGTDATPVATETYIAEVFIPANVTLTGVAVMNGSVASGNIAIALANSTGVVVASSASTAMSGTDAYQRIPFSATYAAVGPATYYVLQQIDNATARVNMHTFGNFGASKKTGETYATFTTVTPPTTFTTAVGPIAGLY